MKRVNQVFYFFIVFFLLLLASMFWWSQQKINALEQQQQMTAYQAESQYQRSFGELSDSVQAMNGQLAQLLVTTSQEQLLLGGWIQPVARSIQRHQPSGRAPSGHA